MKTLVTGGEGFIGGHIAEQLAASSHDVVVIDNFVPYYEPGIKNNNVEAGREAAQRGGGTYELVDASITDGETVGNLVADADAVYH
jgi:UDP-glucose 4-epimerase